MQSAYLSRRLAYFCARRLSLLLSDSPGLLAAHSPHMMMGPNSSGIGAPSPGPPGPGLSPVQLAFSEFLSCAQHGPLVYGLSCMLQVSLRPGRRHLSALREPLGWGWHFNFSVTNVVFLNQVIYVEFHRSVGSSGEETCCVLLEDRCRGGLYRAFQQPSESPPGEPVLSLPALLCWEVASVAALASRALVLRQLPAPRSEPLASAAPGGHACSWCSRGGRGRVLGSVLGRGTACSRDPTVPPRVHMP